MRADVLDHVTLPTGHLRRSPRGDVSAGIVRLLRRELLPVLAVPAGAPCGEVSNVPGYPAYVLRRWRCESGAALFLLAAVEAPAEPLISIGIGWRDPGAAALWRALTGEPVGLTAADGGPLAEPARPWVVDRIDRGTLAAARRDPAAAAEAMVWAADLARCLGWAVLPEGEGAG